MKTKASRKKACFIRESTGSRGYNGIHFQEKLAQLLS
jgi:hypothetical protein